MPHVVSSDEILRRARQKYDAGNYDEVQKILLDAEGLQDVPADVYDLRVATCSRLGDNSAALVEARKMIKQFPKDVRGYLRAGKVLEKMGKGDMAQKIYEYGIQKRPNNIEKLQKLYITPSEPVDLLSVLPQELIEMIFSHLDFRTVVVCLAVCKAWRNSLSDIPRLWYNLDLRHAMMSKNKYLVGNDFITACIKRSRSRITSAQLCELKSRDKVVYALARSCKALESVTLRQRGVCSDTFVNSISPAANLRHLTIGPATEIGYDTVVKLVTVCDSLHSFACSNVSPKHSQGRFFAQIPVRDQMESLILDVTPSVDMTNAVDLREVPLKMPNLVTLNLHLSGARLSMLQSYRVDLTGLIALKQLDIATISAVDVDLDVPDGVRHIGVTKDITVFLDPSQLQSLRLFDLDALQLALCGQLPQHQPWIDPWDRQYLPCVEDASAAAALRKLTLSSFKTWSPDESLVASRLVILLKPYFARLEEFHITNDATEIDDHVLSTIVAHCTQLRAITLVYSKITGIGIKTLCQLKNLQRISLVGEMSSDALDYARSKGIVVTYSLQRAARDSGRRLREG